MAAIQFASKKTPPEIIAAETCITSHVDLSAGTNGALGRYNRVIAVPRVNKTARETGNPSQRILYFFKPNRYAAENARAPVIENSYIFPHGTRFAEMPRKMTPVNNNKKPRNINAEASLPTRSVREKSNFVFLTDAAGVLTDQATSTA